MAQHREPSAGRIPWAIPQDSIAQWRHVPGTGPHLLAKRQARSGRRLRLTRAPKRRPFIRYGQAAKRNDPVLPATPKDVTGRKTHRHTEATAAIHHGSGTGAG